jgi:hypothetical protein
MPVAVRGERLGGRQRGVACGKVAGQFSRPVLLGDGIRFLSSPGLARIDLEPLDSTRSGAITILRFRVCK